MSGKILEALRERVLLCDGGMGSRVQALDLTVDKDYWGKENCTEVLNLSRQGDGGPINSTTTVVLRVYREGFGSFNMGYAATLTVVLFAVILVITIVQLRFLQRRFDY